MKNTPPFPQPRDFLGETLHLLRLTGVLYCRAELSAPWGVDVPRLEGLMTFQVVTRGRCWLEMEGCAPRLLKEGSLTLIPHGTPHRICSDRSVRSEPLFDIEVEKVSERYEIMRYGGGGEVTQIAYGVLSLDQLTAQRVISALPPVLSVDTWDVDTSSWLLSTLRYLASEARQLKAGGEIVITRLADILVIQALRVWLDSAAEARQGWFAALRDEKVGRALLSMHRTPANGWSVAQLAAVAGMSRSAFAARFSELVGESPLRYLTSLRLHAARARLQNESVPLAELAAQHGYESEAAFSRAFKRLFGVAPGSVKPQALEYG